MRRQTQDQSFEDGDTQWNKAHEIARILHVWTTVADPDQDFDRRLEQMSREQIREKMARCCYLEGFERQQAPELWLEGWEEW